MLTAQAHAMSTKDLQDILNGYPYYDSESSATSSCTTSGGSSSSGTLPGTGDAKKTYDYFRSKQLTPAQAAGITGNIEVESGYNPAIVSKAGYHGLAQWDKNIRWPAMVAWAKENNRNELDFYTQLDYIWYEGGKGGHIAGIQKYDDVALTAWYWGRYYEGAVIGGSGDATPLTNVQGLSARTTAAQKVFATYGSDPVGNNPDSSAVTSTGCGGTTGTVDTNGFSFPIAPQTKSGNKTVQYLSQVPCNNPDGCHHHQAPDPVPGDSYAFDLGRQPGGNDSVGAPVYAISDGTIYSVNLFDDLTGCYAVNLLSEKDNFYYAYLHISNVLIKKGDHVNAGQQIAEVGESRCTANGSTPHLHIDRGCMQNGKYLPGGRPSCRDQGIIPLINSLYNGLPE